MIVWCPKCDTNTVKVAQGTAIPMCFECMPPEGCYPYTLESISMLIDRIWVSRTQRIEFNTVDLKKLREDWQDRRYNMPLEGWQRLKDQLKHVF